MLSSCFSGLARLMPHSFQCLSNALHRLPSLGGDQMFFAARKYLAHLASGSMLSYDDGTAIGWENSGNKMRKKRELFAQYKHDGMPGGGFITDDNTIINVPSYTFSKDNCQHFSFDALKYGQDGCNLALDCVGVHPADANEPESCLPHMSLVTGKFDGPISIHAKLNGSELSLLGKSSKKRRQLLSSVISSLSVQNDVLLFEEMKDKKVENSDDLGISNTANEIGLPKVENQATILKRLTSIYDSILVVDNVSLAKKVVSKLIGQYKDRIHACDTEVAKLNVKLDTTIDHGEIICFSIYSGYGVDFGDGKSCIWVDVLDGGGRSILAEFARFLEDSSIKKVWHNYSFDKHSIENYGIYVSGFHADTMHMARLWDSSRRKVGGYSLEALTSSKDVMRAARSGYQDLIGKASMKTVFGKRNVKKDGSWCKAISIASVEHLQREERVPWICYSTLDAISTLHLYDSLHGRLSEMPWKFGGRKLGNSMFEFYEKYWQPFGEVLARMETEGMLIDQSYLVEMEKLAKAEELAAARTFRNWASKYSPDARYMNVGSDSQLRVLFFGGSPNRRDNGEMIPLSQVFKVDNVERVVEEGKKKPRKYRTMTLSSIFRGLTPEMYTPSGWPSVCADALKNIAKKLSADIDAPSSESPLAAFPDREERIEACNAIASLCGISSINSLISNFILPLQGSNILGKNGRVHCSLNINTETGRLSARRPNLQNQPALEKDRYKIRQAFIASPGNSLLIADYGQLELRILAHIANCKSMLDAFKAGGDFHSRTALNMYPHVRDAVDENKVLLEWFPQSDDDAPPVPLLKDAFASERRKAKMVNFSIAYGKTVSGLANDLKISRQEARETLCLWYSERKEVLKWQEECKKQVREEQRVYTLLGRSRRFPLISANMSLSYRNHIERAAINTPVQGSAADVAMLAMLEISKHSHLKDLGWKLLLQVHDEIILEGPSESAETAKAIVVECMSKPFGGKNILRVDLSVNAKYAQDWYSAK